MGCDSEGLEVGRTWLSKQRLMLSGERKGKSYGHRLDRAQPEDSLQAGPGSQKDLVPNQNGGATLPWSF